MASNTALLDNIYPIIEGTFNSNPNNIKALQNTISAYLDRNMSKLSTSGPIHRTLFIDSDKNALFNATGVRPELVNKVIP